MSNNTIQAHFTDTSIIIIDKTSKALIFMSPKSPTSHQTYLINKDLELNMSKSALKRYQIIKELLKSQT